MSTKDAVASVGLGPRAQLELQYEELSELRAQIGQKAKAWTSEEVKAKVQEVSRKMFEFDKAFYDYCQGFQQTDFGTPKVVACNARLLGLEKEFSCFKRQFGIVEYESKKSLSWFGKAVKTVLEWLRIRTYVKVHHPICSSYVHRCFLNVRRAVWREEDDLKLEGHNEGYGEGGHEGDHKFVRHLADGKKHTYLASVAFDGLHLKGKKEPFTSLKELVTVVDAKLD